MGVERPPLPATIRFAIAFIAIDAAGMLVLLALLAPSLLRALQSSPWVLLPAAALAGWSAVAGGALAGLWLRRGRAWFASATLMAASAALAGFPIVQHLVTRGLPPVGRTLAILSAFVSSFLVPLILLLAGRRAYQDVADREK